MKHALSNIKSKKLKTACKPTKKGNKLNPLWLLCARVTDPETGEHLGFISEVSKQSVIVMRKGVTTVCSAKQLDLEGKLSKKHAVDPKYV